MKLGVGMRRPALDGPHIACIIAATAIATTIKQGACRRRAPCSGIAREASAAALPVLLLLFALPAVGLALSALPCRHLLLWRLLRLRRLGATRLRRWLRLRWRGDARLRRRLRCRRNARLRRRKVGCGRRDARLWRRCRRLSCFALPHHGRGVALVTAPWLNRRGRRARHGGRRCGDRRPCNCRWRGGRWRSSAYCLALALVTRGGAWRWRRLRLRHRLRCGRLRRDAGCLGRLHRRCCGRGPPETATSFVELRGVGRALALPASGRKRYVGRRRRCGLLLRAFAAARWQCLRRRVTHDAHVGRGCRNALARSDGWAIEGLARITLQHFHALRGRSQGRGWRRARDDRSLQHLRRRSIARRGRGAGDAHRSRCAPPRRG